MNTFDGLISGFRRRSGELSFLDRLDDLRGRLIGSALVIIVATIIGFVLAMRVPEVFGFAVAPVEPYLQGQKLKYLSPTDPFFITLKLGFCIGLALSLPYLIVQAWGLFAPLLDPREKRLIRVAIGASFVLFAAGLAFCYYLALPLMLRFTMGFQTEDLEQSIVIGEYLKLVLRSMFAFGVAFELPIMILVLTLLGVVTPAFLSAKRRHAIAIIVIVSAVMTPPDVSSLILLALPVWILYEVSIVLIARSRVAPRAYDGRAGDLVIPPVGIMRCFLPVILLLSLVPLAGQLEAQQRQPPPDTAISGAPAIPPPRAPATPPRAPGDTTVAADTTIRPVKPTLSARADSIVEILKALPGFVVTEYTGQRAIYSTETGILRLLGSADVSRGTDRLTADSIEYRERDEIITALGGARVVGESQDITGESLHYDIVRRKATALGAHTQIIDQATWYVSGDVTLEGTQTVFARSAHFTSCDLAIPHYHFESDQVMFIRNKILVGRPARLYFGNVPVMVLPFVVQSLEQGRRSGFLTPRFGLNDIVRSSSGYTRQISDVGFYWAINQYMGAQLSTTWRSGAYTALLGNLDYNWRRQFLNGNVGMERYWQADGSRAFSFQANSSWQPSERTSMSFAGRYASSSDFIRSATYDPREATQDLNSSFSLSRRFGWGRASLGADRRQSIANGDVSMTLPSFSFSPPSITAGLLSFTPGVVYGSRSINRFADNVVSRRQDQDVTRFRVGPSLSIGNLSLSTNAELNRSELEELLGQTTGGATINLPGINRDDAKWDASASYRQQLIGSTNISPNIALSQQLLRDTLTADEYLAAPMRLSFGAGLNTNVYGFFPGVGGYSAIRHRLSPILSYSYAPEVVQTALQERVFGPAGGREQNRISLSISQTFEAKLRTPPPPPPPAALPNDSITGDTIPQARVQNVPSDPGKVTLLSLTTSPFEYDFIQAREEGNGFVTTRVSNTITSDYLRGLSIQMEHELFDRSALNPQDPETRARLGSFSPRLSSLSTAFQLGPQSAMIQWVQRLAFTPRLRPGQTEGVAPGAPESDVAVQEGQGAATGNSRGTGGGVWNIDVQYQYSRPPKVFSPDGPVDAEAVQTTNGNINFQLSPNWSVNWATSYSLTDKEFGAHRINFRRDLHEWQANFSFYQTPTGNTAFEFYVELTHNTDLRFDYAERNLGVDRQR